MPRKAEMIHKPCQISPSKASMFFFPKYHVTLEDEDLEKE